VIDDIPREFQQDLAKNLARFAFQEINPQTNPEYSIGWVPPFDPLEGNLAVEKVVLGKYILLGIRRDKKSISAPMLKAQISEALRAKRRERNGRKLSKEETNEVREQVKDKMIRSVSPVTNFYEMAWNYETGEIYFSSQAAKSATEFAELFEETFKLSLEDMNLVARTEDYIARKGLGLELIDLEPSNFGA
jgi:DNA recombination-dependent growth factor C